MAEQPFDFFDEPVHGRDWGLGTGERRPARSSFIGIADPRGKCSAGSDASACAFRVSSPQPPVPSLHSGSGWPRVSGANGITIRPRRKIAHMLTPAYRNGHGLEYSEKTWLVSIPSVRGPSAATKRPTL